MNLFVPGNPVPQGSKRALLRKGSNIPIIIDNNRIGLANWRAIVTAHVMRDRQQHGDTKPIEGPVAVRLEFWLKRPLDHYLPINSKRTVPELKADAPRYCTTAPDIDKLTRAILDALTDADVYHDDAQVVKVVASKPFTDTRTGVLIAVVPWNGP